MVKWRKKLDPVLQGTLTECGLACICMVLNSYNINISLIDLRNQYKVSQRGTSLNKIIHILEDFGIASRPLRAELEDLAHLNCPAILHWDFEHFVVLERYTDKHLYIIDPQLGRRRISMKEASAHFTGIAMEFSQAEIKTYDNSLKPITILDLIAGVRSKLNTQFATLIFLTLSISAIALSMPFMLKISIDTLIPKSDTETLNILLISFVFLALFQFVLQLVRASSLANFRRDISEHISNDLFRNILWARMEFYENRNTGTIVTQYRSINVITSTLSELLITNLIDGFAVIIGTIIIWLYSWQIGLLLTVTILSYFAVFMLMQQELKSRIGLTIQNEAKENAFFVENLNAIQTIKLYGKELNRLSGWKNIRENVESSISSSGKYRSKVFASLELIAGIAWLMVVYLSIGSHLQDELSMGLMMAMISWTTFIISRSQNMAKGISDIDSLQTHVSRIEDILCSDKEAGMSHEGRHKPRELTFENNDIEVRDIWFRFGNKDPWVLKDASLMAKKGKLTVLAGSSGEGKTTLLKCLTGLYEPTKGGFYLNNEPVPFDELFYLRTQVATVTQNDKLFMGSIAANISFFDLTPDIERIKAACEVACIAEFVETLTMKYDSLVGRDGAGFSGGQIQRFLLARALYKQPRLLLLDEFTSNLDEQAELAIITNLKKLGITIITAAHRRQVIEQADHVYQIDNGEIKITE